MIPHYEATIDVICRVISIKQRAWPYPEKSQRKWIEENLKPEDIHVFLCFKGEDVAYLNLVQIQVQINEKNYEGYGIGNVCAKIKGKGYGNQLIGLANDYLKTNNKVGLLFCHTPLIKFYTGCNWTLLPSEICINPKLDAEIRTMTYNTPYIIDSLSYIGRLF